jgi:hypothetical protein
MPEDRGANGGTIEREVGVVKRRRAEPSEENRADNGEDAAAAAVLSPPPPPPPPSLPLPPVLQSLATVSSVREWLRGVLQAGNTVELDGGWLIDAFALAYAFVPLNRQHDCTPSPACLPAACRASRSVGGQWEYATPPCSLTRTARSSRGFTSLLSTLDVATRRC